MRGSGGPMRQLCMVAAMLALLPAAEGQSLRINEQASKVVLTERTYAVALTANSSERLPSAILRLEVIAPSGGQLASSSSTTKIKIGANQLLASVTLPE